jgi:hypothetical protein
MVVTEPLTDSEFESVGWHRGELLGDMAIPAKLEAEDEPP